MANQQYNAFISYRRTPHDTAVAKEIQHSLEHYRVPGNIRSASGRDRIDRIFRDQEELEITSNLSRRIEDALQASEYLIVICSPQYSQSQWCLHELETFIRLRGRDHVLCVLSEGEPPAVFPEILLHCTETATAEDGSEVTIERDVEPLACDYRGNFKEARRTELPRLAAVLLGCSYDELVMRQEKYRRRRLAAILTASSTLAVIAISYLLWSNAKIASNYRQSQISESRLLAMESLSAYESQDRLRALDTAMQALVGDTGERPITDEAQFAMAQASFAYATPYHWLETWRIDEISDIKDFFVSRSGRYLVCMDRSGLFRSYELKTRRELCSFRLMNNGVPDTPIEGLDGELLCYAGTEVVSAGYLTGEVNWRLPLQYQSIGGISRSSGGAFVAAADAFAVQILTADGEPYLSMPLPDTDGMYLTTELCWSPDDRQIAVKLKETGASRYRAGIFDVETSAFTLLKPGYHRIDLFRFDEDGIRYLLGNNGEEDSGTYGATTVYSTVAYELTAFQDGELIWQQRFPAHTMTDSASLEPCGGPEKQTVFALGNSIWCFDAAGVPTGVSDIHEDVRSISPNGDGSVGFVTWSGKMGTAFPVSGSSTMTKTFPAKIDRIANVLPAGGEEPGYIVATDGNLCIYESVSDENARIFRGGEFNYRPDGLVRSEDRALLLVNRTLRLYDLESRAEIKTAELDQADAWHLLTAIDTTAYLLRICGDSAQFGVLALDLNTGETLREDRLPVSDFFSKNHFLTAPFSREDAIYLDAFYAAPSPVAVQGDMLYLHDGEDINRIWRYRLTDGTTDSVDLGEALGEEKTLLYTDRTLPLPAPLAVSPDQKLLFTACTDRRDGSRSALLVRLEDAAVITLPGEPDDLSTVCFTKDRVLYSGARELYVCDFEGKQLYSIPYTGDSPLSFAGSGETVYCVFPDGSLTVYDGETELRTVPLSFWLDSEAIDGKAFRYEIFPSRLYLYCGNEMNVIMLDSDGSTAVYYASSVLGHLQDREELLVFSYDHRRSHRTANQGFHLAAFREYSVQELIERGREQLSAFSPVVSD